MRPAEPAHYAEPPHAPERLLPAEPMRPAEPAHYAEASHPAESMRAAESAPRYAEAPHPAEPRSVSAVPPVAPTGPLVDDLPASAARPLSFLRNGGGSAATAMTAPAPTAYVAEELPPSGPLMDGLPPSAARPLSFLRNKGGTAQPSAPATPPPAPAGATPLSRTTEPAPTVRITNIRRPEPPPGPSEPPPYSDDDARYYPEEHSPEGCASGECLPDAEPVPGEDSAGPAEVASAIAARASFPASPAAAEGTARAPFQAPHGNAAEPGPRTPISDSRASFAAPPAVDGPTARAPFPAPNAGAVPASRAPYSATPVGPAPAARAPFPAPNAGPAARAPFPPSAPDSDPEPEPEAAPRPVAGGRDNPNRPLVERWRAAVESVKAASPRHGAALANGRLMSMRAGEIVLGYLPAAGFHRTAVTSPGGKATIDKALAEHFGRPVKLTIQEVSAEDTAMGLSIAEQDAQSRAAHEKSTDSKVRNHPAVRAVLKFLGGEIEHIQVYEPERPSAGPAAETPDDSA
nr:DNA polymerase III subunit gamma/tau [Myxococcus sp. RHSTA-1-4]